MVQGSEDRHNRNLMHTIRKVGRLERAKFRSSSRLSFGYATCKAPTPLFTRRDCNILISVKNSPRWKEGA